jgi:CheY-like chemotaxis protein
MAYTVLIVDDNDAFRGMLCSVLAMRGYQTIPARTGPEALTLASQHEIDAVLADIEMPGMDGFEFAKQLSEQNKAQGRDVPIWIMTGTLRPGTNRKATGVGAVLLMRKPLSPDETCAAIAAEIDRRKRGALPAPTEPPPS